MGLNFKSLQIKGCPLAASPHAKHLILKMDSNTYHPLFEFRSSANSFRQSFKWNKLNDVQYFDLTFCTWDFCLISQDSAVIKQVMSTEFPMETCRLVQFLKRCSRRVSSGVVRGYTGLGGSRSQRKKGKRHQQGRPFLLATTFLHIDLSRKKLTTKLRDVSSRPLR